MGSAVEGIEQKKLRLGSVAPDFKADTIQGPIKFHEYIGNNGSVSSLTPKILPQFALLRFPACPMELLTTAWGVREPNLLNPAGFKPRTDPF